MIIKSFQLNNFRSFSDTGKINLSENVNVLIGPNNAGKSSILLGLLEIQNSNLQVSDIRIGTSQLNTKIIFDRMSLNDFKKSGIKELSVNQEFGLLIKRSVKLYDKNIEIITPPTGISKVQFQNIENSEPDNVIYPYLSKRKSVTYEETINKKVTNIVSGNFRNLYAKIDRISTEFYPAHSEYLKACEKIIGFPISTIASDNGKKAAFIVNSNDHIPLSSMGEGIVNMVGLIVDLCIADNKIFIIEEPENDIHPEALKSLLELIILKSENNQFIISTHSNIVTRYLGSIKDSKLFRIALDFTNNNQPPISEISEIPHNINDRIEVLEELGYEFTDLYIWNAWMFFEESSAEYIVREYLIPWFYPKLSGKVRTFSARTKDELKLKFSDFNRLFVFLHLEQAYKNRVWILIDAGDNEKAILDELKKKYVPNGWKKENFIQLSNHDFEEYYPEEFEEEVSNLGNHSGKDRQDLKTTLLEKLKQWVNDNPELAKEKFEISFEEIIKVLKSIHKNIISSK